LEKGVDSVAVAVAVAIAIMRKFDGFEKDVKGCKQRNV
jgi:hypothetical protein